MAEASTEHKRKGRILDFFPKDKTPREVQRVILEKVEELLLGGAKNILIEAPVGTGKSAIAVTIGKFLGSAHILTPQKRLQSQYEEDFAGENLCGIRGRSSYRCSVDPLVSTATCISKTKLWLGKIDLDTHMACVDKCPYTIALREADEHQLVVHNYHSFLFQAILHGKFPMRSALIFDEAHELEGITRDFLSHKKIYEQKNFPADFNLKKYLDPRVPLSYDEIIEIETASYRFLQGALSPEEKIEWETNLVDLHRKASVYSPSNSILSCREAEKVDGIEVSITTIDVGSFLNSQEHGLYRFGEVRIFMSGTIFDAKVFSKNIGLPPGSYHYVKSGTSFRKENRPIYLKKQYVVNTSHKNWDSNFREMISKIQEILGKFPDVKGIIHCPSYLAVRQIEAALGKTGRILTHTPENIEQQLEFFYASKKPYVLLSPSCYQGVDLKYDRARFQIILRVPYMSIADPFVKRMAEESFTWYNHQALVTFGQQLGRVVRADDDFGATILLDSRFREFVYKNRAVIPRWIQESIIVE